MIFRVLLVINLWVLNYWLFKHANTLSVSAFTAANILGSVLLVAAHDLYSVTEFYRRKGFFMNQENLCVACEKQPNCDNSWYKSGLCRDCLYLSRQGSCSECHNSILYCCCPDGDVERAAIIDRLHRKYKVEAS